MSTTTYIVTGGAGFIGSNLVAEILRRRPEAHVVVVDPMLSGSFANIVEALARAGLRPFRGEVLPEHAGNMDWPHMLRTTRAAGVFHLGAITDTTVTDEQRMLHANLGGFYADLETGMLAACHATDVPLVYASSAATYGSPADAADRTPFPEHAAGRPSNVYGFSKWLMEQEHARFEREHAGTAQSITGRATIVGLRYFNVFGPGESRKGHMASMVYQLATRLLAGQAPRLFTDGTQARDQVPVEDVVDCTLRASGLFGASPIRSGVYNLGSGRATSFNQIVRCLREALEIPAGTLETEYFEMPPAVRRFYQDFTCADMRLAAEGLSWRPARDPERAIVEYARLLRAGRA
ncbi:MAG: NAD-dependent epimerase/dehydratase family protein [Planctomycetota bacterium]|nr:NAD-dependent epimerase/dehydratase family protein [Planctomycetota bacterium]